MPSSNVAVTLLLRYCRVGAPCGGASVGMAEPVSGCKEAAREVASFPLAFWTGVLVRGGIGLGAFTIDGAMTAATENLKRC
jgi:hypothetical protein